jgi:hypothetical protein
MALRYAPRTLTDSFETKARGGAQLRETAAP